jgi:hypothetical protein
MATTEVSEARTSGGKPKAPVLRETRYDHISSGMMAVVLALIVTCAGLFVWWFSNKPPVQDDFTPVEILELPGGVETGSPDETLKVDSPEEEIPDPAVVEEQEEVQIEEVLENVIELSDQATNQLQPTYETDAESSGKIGSASGTGRRALGMGPGERGIPRAERWFITFSDRDTIDEYARQLDFFGIQFAVLNPGQPAQILSKFSDPRPAVRQLNQGSGDQLYFSWQGGSRRQADAKLCEKAGVQAGNRPILHLYPKETEARLAQLERQYRNRPPEQVRRTYFIVQREGRGYKFVVTRQIYF